MTITLNHAIVTASDNDEAARFFATVMGLDHTPAHPDNGEIDTAHPLGGRGVFFSDSSGNLYELISP